MDTRGAGIEKTDRVWTMRGRCNRETGTGEILSRYKAEEKPKKKPALLHLKSRQAVKVLPREVAVSFLRGWRPSRIKLWATGSDLKADLASSKGVNETPISPFHPELLHFCDFQATGKNQVPFKSIHPTRTQLQRGGGGLCLQRANNFVKTS